MPRYPFEPNISPIPDIITPIRDGGTGASDDETAASNLNGISMSILGVSDGVAKLDDTGNMSTFAIYPSIQGPTSLYTGDTGTYYITDYDSRNSYSYMPLSGEGYVEGTVLFADGVITFTAPDMPGMSGFIISDRAIYVNIIAQYVIKPSILNPSNGTIVDHATVVINSDTYSSMNNNDTHLSSTWQIATDSNFTTIINDSINDAINLTQWIVSGLVPNTTYYVRVKYTGSLLGDSDWSDTITITTSASIITAADRVMNMLGSPNPDNYIHYGVVAISDDGNTAIVQEDGYTRQSSIYIYTRLGTSWILQQSFNDPSSPTHTGYGLAMAISSDGNIAAIGAYITMVGENSEAGQVYIYMRSNGSWSLLQTLNASDNSINAKYGVSVAMSKDASVLVIGAYNAKINGVYGVGKAYIYILSNGVYVEQQILTSDVPSYADNYGCSVATNGDGSIVMVGSQLADIDTSVDTGKVYIYTRSGDTWTQQQIILPSNIADNIYYGYSLAISNDGSTAVVASLSGSIYILTNNNGVWSESQVITSSGGYGTSIAITYDGSVIYVGAPDDNTGGRVDILVKDVSTWSTLETLQADTADTTAWFGSNIGITSTASIALIGAAYATDRGYVESGKCYTYM